MSYIQIVTEVRMKIRKLLICQTIAILVGNNADLYAANQERTDLINEAHMEDVPLRFIFMGQDVQSYFTFVSLSAAQS